MQYADREVAELRLPLQHGDQPTDFARFLAIAVATFGFRQNRCHDFWVR